MTDIVKIKQDGVQIYPQSHWKAIIGAPESVKGEKEKVRRAIQE